MSITTLKPSVASSATNFIPDFVQQENPNFVKFMEYYYQWLEQSGGLSEIRNLVELKDIDNEEYIDRNVNGLIAMIPTNMRINNKPLLVKHLRSLFKSKGTEESIKTFLRALLNDNVDIEWNRDKIFSTSSANYVRTAQISVYGDAEAVEGVVITQLSPSFAKATVESKTTVSRNGRLVNLLQLDPVSVSGNFVIGSSVTYLKNTTPRTDIEIKSYYRYTNKVETNLVMMMLAEMDSNPIYVGKIIKQIGNDAFYATVSGVNYKSKYGNSVYLSVELSNEHGTIDVSGGDLYFVDQQFINNHYTKAEIVTCTVAPSIVDVEITNGGSNYVSGQPVRFIGGDGIGVSGKINSVTGGPVESIMVLNGGVGYDVGDTVLSSNSNAYGGGLKAVVSAVDGVDAVAIPNMEIDKIIFKGGVFPAGVWIGINGGKLNKNYSPAQFISVDDGMGGTTFNVMNGGGYRELPAMNETAIMSVEQNGIATESFDVITTESGDRLVFSKEQFFDPDDFEITWKITELILDNQGHSFQSADIVFSGGIGEGAQFNVVVNDGVIADKTATVLDGGANYTWAFAVFSGGVGENAIAEVKIAGGAISGVNIIRGGKNYSAPVTISIIGDGSGAVIDTISNIIDGTITDVIVTDSGKNYSSNVVLEATNVTATTFATFSQRINNGKIEQVTVIDGGEGYVSTPSISFGGIQTAATATASISNNGPMATVSIESAGEGYWDTSEITPMSLAAPGGSGAILIPVLDQYGRFSRVDILNGGYGYTSGDSLVITADVESDFLGYSIPGEIGNLLLENGTDRILLKESVTADLEIVADNIDGSITKILVNNAGYGYKLGTKAYVFGDGIGAEVFLTAESGITNISIVDGGYNYDETTSINVLDETGYGTDALVVPIIENGKIVDLKILNNGYNYRKPKVVVQCENLAATGAVLLAKQKRNIKSAVIASAGSGYSNANIMVVGDGFGANLVASVSNGTGSISEITLTSTGSNYMEIPTISFVDNSGYGAVSKVAVVNGGENYQLSPYVFLKDKLDPLDESIKIAYGARLGAYGSNIGAVSSVSIDEPGADYSVLPFVVFNRNLTISYPAAFKIGEEIAIESDRFHPINITTENGISLVAENLDNLVVNTTSYTPVGRVSSVDYNRNLVVVTPYNDFYMLCTETDNETFFIDDTGLPFITEDSFNIIPGDVIIGVESGVKSSIFRIDAAYGTPILGATSFSNKSHTNRVGFTNTNESLIHDNMKIQTHAYVVKSAFNVDSYESFLKDVVHPAGYAMFGDVVSTKMTMIDSFQTVSISGYVYVAIVSAMIALNSINQTTRKTLSWLDENKFEIDTIVPNYLTDGVSRLTTETGDLINLFDSITHTSASEVFDHLTFEDFDTPHNTVTFDIMSTTKYSDMP